MRKRLARVLLWALERVDPGWDDGPYDDWGDWSDDYRREDYMWDGPQTMTCRDCGHVIEARITDDPYLQLDERFCEHMTEGDVSRVEGLRLTDCPDLRER